MQKSEKRKVRNLFREGNRLMEKTVYSQLSPISDHGKSMREFKSWCQFVGITNPKIRLYFRLTFNSVLESARNEYYRPKFKDAVTGELLSPYDTEVIMLHDYHNRLTAKNY